MILIFYFLLATILLIGPLNIIRVLNVANPADYVYNFLYSNQYGGNKKISLFFSLKKNYLKKNVLIIYKQFLAWKSMII